MKKQRKNKGYGFHMLTMLLCACLLCPFLMGMAATTDNKEETQTLVPAYEYGVSVSGIEGWFNTPTEIELRINDLTGAGWTRVELSGQADGERIDLTEELLEKGVASYTASENGTYFVFVTDPAGGVHTDTFSLNCFDFDGPVVQASVDGTKLQIQACDRLSGVEAIQVNDKLYTRPENGALTMPIEENKTDAFFRITALDTLQNESPLSIVLNPFYRQAPEEHGEHCPADCDCRKDEGSPADTAQTPKPTAKPTASKKPAATETPTKAEEPASTKGPSPSQAEDGVPFTINGDAVTRDLLYDKYTNKQFVVLETRGGETFYLVIDYDKPLDAEGEHYETYFLNLVDATDLKALLGEEDTEASTDPVCTCTERCEVGHINTDCELCKTNMTECCGKQTIAPTSTPTPTPAPEPALDPAPEARQNNGMTALLGLLLLAAIAGGGAFYWFRIKKDQPRTKGPIDLDDYDYGQSDDSDEGYKTESDYDTIEETAADE